MEITAHAKKYRVIFEDNFNFIKASASIEQSLWVIDQNVFTLYKEMWERNLSHDKFMLIEAKESEKVIDTALRICEKLTELPGKRNVTLISVGGGIVQDITGFAANILYRGIKWIFIPTTLLAACDSCIGSKTSLNYKNFKNLLGTFYPPDEIHIYPEFFNTLSEVDYLSGLGEVVKFNIMAGIDYIELLHERMQRILKRDEKLLFEYVHKSLEFKKTFIEADEYDRGIRIHLNFAHTFGHAFETVTNYAIPHGTAVAMGTIIANYISCRRGWLSKDVKNSIQNVLLEIINIPLLEEQNGLQINTLSDMSSILNAIKKDKKQVDTNLTAVLFKNDVLELSIVHDLRCDEIEEAVNGLIILLDKKTDKR